MAAAVRELSLHESQLYVWRSKQQQMTSSERENELASKNARLTRQLAERDEELAILQNACVESFFHSLKVECIHGERLSTGK